MDIKAEKLKTALKGTIEIPSDKSVSHRAAMFAMLTKDEVEITNYSLGADCRSTLQIVQQLGCTINYKDKKNFTIDARKAMIKPDKKLYCGNSGTTMRLMAGILAGQNFDSILTGDESLSKRPMKRIIEPLSLMGAEINSNNFKAPLEIKGTKLKGIEYNSPLASAQVKSAVLLAGLFAKGKTTFTEPHLSRNHTELMLKYLGANIETNGNTTTIRKSKLMSKPINICGDISSAAFFMAAAAIVPDSEVILRNVGLNPTRAGIIEVMKNMGARIEILGENLSNCEPVGDIKVSYSTLKPTVIEGEIIPRLIDELPIIALLATQAAGTTVIKDAGDLRNKETDRIKAVVTEFRKIGANIEEIEDGFVIQGKTALNRSDFNPVGLKGGTELETYHDHRIAMTLYIAGLICESPVIIKEFQWVDISFPEFYSLINAISAINSA